MQNILTLISDTAYIDLPHGVLGWVGWVLLLAILIVGMRHWWERGYGKLKQRWWLLAALGLAVPFTALFIGIRLPGNESLTLPNLPVESSTPAMMFFMAVPWVLAAGLFGTLPSVVIGLLSGLFFALWETHSAFTPLEFAIFAMIFSASVRQRYRTSFYHFLRNPLGAAAIIGIFYIPISIIVAFFSSTGDAAVRVDYALTGSWILLLARTAELVVACILAETVYLLTPKLWGRSGPLVPSPAETSLQTRFFFWTFPLILVLLLTLMFGDWIVAGNAAREMIRERLSSTAQVVSDSLPYFLESGQGLLLNQARPELIGLDADTQKAELSRILRSLPFFTRIGLLGQDGNLIALAPGGQSISLGEREKVAAGLAFKGVPVQTYTLNPVTGDTSAQFVFVAAIADAEGRTLGVLMGWTDLRSNPFTLPAIQALKKLQEMGGEGSILDENNKVLYYTLENSSLVMSDYLGVVPESADFFEETSQLGTRRMVYSQPITGRPWTVVVSLPSERVQRLALSIAIPLLLILLGITVVVYLLLRFSLRGVTTTLRTLSQQATMISQGQLNSPLMVSGVDEVGQLSNAFERMRLSLKARLLELNRLLEVSQGVAANLNIEKAVQPILKAALGDGVSAVRMVLVRPVSLDQETGQPVSFSAGPAAEIYSGLDSLVIEQVQRTEMLVVPNMARMRRLNITPGQRAPAALLGMPIYHESQFFGALWIGYDTPRQFTEENIRFLSTLTAQSALAAANSSLYATAEIGRQRLEAVLYSTPEPVLVFDEQGRLLLVNPAAMQTPGLINSATSGKTMDEVLAVPDLLNLAKVPLNERIQSREVTLPGNKVYHASVSPVAAESRRVGKIVILQDITQFKELDAIKTEFVSTVSHDLRSPLTLMKGYSAMLQMVGELNDQQQSYTKKIMLGVENMTRLVNNLLDLGRIETGIGLRSEKVNLNEIVDQVMTSLQPQAVQNNITLALDTQEMRPMTVNADPALIQQAFYNLVDNAVKYAQTNGQVKVRLVRHSQSVVFEVQDNGIGIAPLDLPRLFEKFYRSGRREAYQQRGTGLGLAIVKSIAERHKGRVWVESQLGRGSIFYFEIPAEPLPGGF
ncbi:MAG TPA: ATP-binding protein [Longilinea sp.]|nr:ATP-binding protein [Longilinea sp.]